MSKQVDERVVKMEFDNKNFESNVKTSMSTLDKLKAKLNLSGASKGFENISSAAKKVDVSPIGAAIDSVKIKFSSMQVIGATALANLTNSAISTAKKIESAMTSALVEGGKQRSLNIEQAKFQLEGLGVAWNDIKDDINYGVKDTAYGLDAAAKVASQLVASNIEIGDSMKTSLRAVSGVAAMTSSSYEEIGHIFTTVAGNGKLMTIQLHELSNRGLNAAATLAGYLGKTEAEIRDMVTHGEIDFETFAAAMDDAFGQHAKDANKTFTGAMSNVRAALSRIGADVATPYFENLRNIFNALIPVIDGVHVKLKPLIDLTSNVFGKIGDFAVQKLNTFSESLSNSSPWDKFKNQLSGMGVPIDEFQNALIETARSHDIAIDDMIAKEGSLENTFKSGWVNAGLISETLLGMAESVEAAKGEFIDFREIVDQVINGDFGNGIVRVNKLTEAGYEYATVQGLVNDVIYGRAVDWENLSNAQLENIGYTEEQISVIRDLAEEAERTGTPINDLILSLSTPDPKSMFFTSIANALTSFGKILTAIKDAWNETFNFGNFNIIEMLVSKIGSLSDSLIISDNALNNVKRTFSGLFAILDIVRLLVGGPLRIAFEIFKGILSGFNLDILGFTAMIGDGIVAIRNWIKEHNFLAEAGKKVADVIKKVTTVIKEFVTKFKSFPEVQKAFEKIKEIASKLFDNLKKWTDNAKKYIRDFLDKFKEMDHLSFDNIKNALKGIGDTISNVFTAFKTNTFKSIGNFFTGIGNAIKKAASPIGGAFDAVKNKVLEFIEFFKSKFSNIGFGEIFAVGFAISVITTLKSIGKALDVLSKPLSAINGVLDEFKNTLKAYQGEIKSNIIFNVAKSIALLAASVALLSNMNQSNIWSAVGALSVLSAVLIGLSIAFQAASKKLGNAKAPGLNIAAIATSIAILGFSLKSIAKIKPEDLLRSVLAVIALLVTMTAVMNNLGSGKSSTKESALNILAFAVSVRIVASALKALNGVKLDAGSIAVLVGIMGSITLFMAAANKTGENAKKAGLGILAIAASLLLMVQFLKSLSNLKIDAGSIGKLVLIVGTIIGLLASTRLAGKNADKAGVGILAVAGSMYLMIRVLKKLSNEHIDVSPQMVKTLITIVGLIAALMAATRLAGQNAMKAGVGVLAISVAVGIISASMGLLSMIDPEGLERARNAVRTIGIILGLLIAATKLATDCKGTIVALSIAIGVLVASTAALSMLDPEGLERGKNAVIQLVGIMSLLVAATKFGKKITGTVWGLVGVIAALGAVVWALSNFAGDKALEVTSGLSVLILSLSGSMFILSKSKGVSYETLLKTTMLAAIVSAMGYVAGMLQNMQLAPSIETAASLSILAVGLSAAIPLLSAAGSASKYAFIGILALVALIAAVGVLAGVIGGLMTAFPDIEKFLNKGLPVLHDIGKGIAGFFTGIIEAFAGLALDLLPQVGTALSDFVNNLKPFFNTVSEIDMSAVEGVFKLSAIFLALSSSAFLGGLMNFITFITSGPLGMLSGNGTISGMFDELIKASAKIKELVSAFDGIDTERLEGIGSLLEGLAALTFVTPSKGGLLNFIMGEKDFGKFGESLKPFAKGLKEFSNELDGLDTAAVERTRAAVGIIIELTKEVPASWGIIPMIIGIQNPEEFGNRLSAFAKGLVSYSTEISGMNTDAVVNTKNFVSIITALTKEVPASWGIIPTIMGINNPEEFGNRLSAFAKGMVMYSAIISRMNTEAVAKTESMVQAVVSLGKEVPLSGGLFGLIMGNGSIDGFGKNLTKFATHFISYADTIKRANIDHAALKSASNSINDLLYVANRLPNSGGLTSITEGDNTFQRFGTDLLNFIRKFKEVSDEAGKVDYTKIEELANAIRNVMAAFSQIEFEPPMPSQTEGGGAFGRYKDKINNLISETNNAVPQVKEAGTNLKKAFSEGFASPADFQNGGVGGSFTSPVKPVVDKITEESQQSVPQVQQAAGTIVNSLTSGFKRETIVKMSEIGNSMSHGVVNGVMSSMPDVENAGSFLSGSLSSSFSKSGLTEMSTASEDVIKNALGALNQGVGPIGNLGWNFGKTASDKLKSTDGLMREAGITVSEAGADGLSTSFPEYSEIMRNTASEISQALVDAGYSTEEAGKIVGTLGASGLASTNDQFLQAAADAANGASDGVQSDSGEMEAAGSELGMAGATGLESQSGTFDTSGAMLGEAGVTGASGTSGSFSVAGSALGEALSSGLSSNSGSVSGAGASVGEAGAAGASGTSGSFSAAGSNMAGGLAGGILSGASSVVSAAVSIASSALSAAKNALGINSPSKEFAKLGVGVGEGFVKGIEDRNQNANVTSSITAMAQGVIDSAKDTLQINSPSRAFIALGNYIGEGLAQGIRESSDEAVAASTEMSERVAEIAEKSFEDIEAWVSDAKHFDELIPEEELALWNAVMEKYEEGSEERLKAEKNAYSVYKDLYKDRFDASKKWIDNEKDYNRLSVKEELEAWERIREQYKEDSEERMEADKEVYKLKHELIDESVDALETEIQKQKDLLSTLEEGTLEYNNVLKEIDYDQNLLLKAKFENSKNWIDEEKYYNRLSLQEELEAWERVQERYEDGSEERKEADKEVYRLKHELIDNSIYDLQAEIRKNEELLGTLEEGTIEYKNLLKEIIHDREVLDKAEYENSESWIEKEDKLNRLGLADKLAAKRRELKYEGRTAEEIEKLRLEEYEIIKEIDERKKQMYKSAEDAVKEHNNKLEDLEKEKSDKIKEIEEKLADDIQNLNDDYESKLEARIDSLYKAYGLFDEITKKDKVKGSALMKNLQDQVAEFEDWETAINNLSGRGLSEEFIEELQEMGPSAIQQLKALNSLSDSQLAQYADLWADKHKEATDRATEELKVFRKETDTEIENLKIKANKEIDEVKSKFQEDVKELETTTNATLDSIEKDFRNSLYVVKEDWEENFKEMGNSANTLLREAGWDETGEYVIDGFTQGIKRGSTDLLATVRETMNQVIVTSKEVLDSHSPSREFMKIGGYIMQGLAIGVDNEKDEFLNTTADAGNEAIRSITNAMSIVDAIVNGDMDIQPTIRPVVDLSDVDAGVSLMNRMFAANYSAQLGMGVGSSIQNGNKILMDEMTAKIDESNSRLSAKFSDAMEGVKGDIAGLVDEVGRLQVVIDGDTLVGAITPKVDRSLGIKAAMKRRGTI